MATPTPNFCHIRLSSHHSSHILVQGHDPHATDADDSANREIESNAEKARGLLELARHQNLTGGRGGAQAGGDNFSRQLFLGLKGGKKRADANNPNAGVLDADTRALLEESSSSSEDEFMDERKQPAKAGSDHSSEESQKKKRKRRKEKSKKSKSKSKKRKRRKEKSRSDRDDSRADRRRRSERDRDSGSDEDSVHKDRRRDND